MITSFSGEKMAKYMANMICLSIYLGFLWFLSPIFCSSQHRNSIHALLNLHLKYFIFFGLSMVVFSDSHCYNIEMGLIFLLTHILQSCWAHLLVLEVFVLYSLRFSRWQLRYLKTGMLRFFAFQSVCLSFILFVLLL